MYVFIVISSCVIGFLLSEKCRDNKNYKRLTYHLETDTYPLKQHYYNMRDVNEQIKKLIKYIVK